MSVEPTWDEMTPLGPASPGGCVESAPVRCCRPAGKCSLGKSDGQTSRVMDKGREWLEWITKIPGHLLTELRPSRQPVAEMAALLVMGKMKIMQKLGENMTF